MSDISDRILAAMQPKQQQPSVLLDWDVENDEVTKITLRYRDGRVVTFKPVEHDV